MRENTLYIILISTFLAYLSNKLIYKICQELNQNKKRTLIIYLTIISVSVLAYNEHGLTPEYIKYLALIPFIITISIIDYNTTYIYDITIVSGIMVQGIILLCLINTETNTISHISGLLIGSLVPYILAKITKGLGEGDIGLYALCGIALGHGYTLYMIALSFIVAFAYCIYKLLKNDLKNHIPFAPSISLATIIIMITKYDVLNTYFDIIKRI